MSREHPNNITPYQREVLRDWLSRIGVDEVRRWSDRQLAQRYNESNSPGSPVTKWNVQTVRRALGIWKGKERQEPAQDAPDEDGDCCHACGSVSGVYLSICDDCMTALTRARAEHDGCPDLCHDCELMREELNDLRASEAAAQNALTSERAKVADLEKRLAAAKEEAVCNAEQFADAARYHMRAREQVDALQSRLDAITLALGRRAVEGLVGESAHLSGGTPSAPSDCSQGDTI